MRYPALSGLSGAILRRLALTTLAVLGAPAAYSQDAHTSRWEFSEKFIRDVWLHPIRTLDVTVLGAATAHDPANDCEIHIGVELEDQSVSDFVDAVLEPPNVCKDTSHSRSGWKTFYNQAAGEACRADGFIRVWPEHLTSGAPPSNPKHIMELHPLRALTCPSVQMDFRQQLAAHSDLGYKTGRHIETILRTFQLWVRRTLHPDSDALNQVEFDYRLCVPSTNGETCGRPNVPNFGRVKAKMIGTTKRCSGGGADGEAFRTIIGRARARGRTGSPVARAHLTKFYALPGTNFYTSLGDECSPPGAPLKSDFDVLGIFTVDPLAVKKTLDRIQRDGLDGQWIEVAFPVAFIIFDEL